MPPEPDAGSKQREWPRRAVGLCLLLLWWLPWLPPLWQLLFPHWECPVSDPGVGITDTSRTQIAMLALTALALSGWRPRLEGPRSAGMWTATFLAWSVLASLAGSDPVESLFFVQGWLAAACVLVCTPAIIPKNPDWRCQLATLHLPAIVAGIVCLGPVLYAQPDYRVAGPFQLPGALATWLILILPSMAVEVLLARGWTVPLALLSATLTTTALALTISRAAWIVAMLEMVLLMLLMAERPPRALLGWGLFGAAALGVLILTRHSFSGVGLLSALAGLCLVPLGLLVARRQLPGAPRLLLLALLVAGLTAAIYPDQALGSAASKRLSTLTATDDSAVGRVQFWRAALALSVSHPVLGTGPGRFGESYPLVQQHYYYFSDSAHGALVEAMAEIGWVGMAIFVAAFLLVLRDCHIDPWRYPRQRAPLVGLLMGGLYCQVEVGYHFAFLWVTGAFLLATLKAAGPAKPVLATTTRTSLWIAPLLAILLWTFFLQRACENSVRQLEAKDTYAQARAVSDRFPIWPKPTLTALAYGLRTQRSPAELDPLVRRALTYAKEDSVSYQLAAEVALLRRQYPEARALFEKALALDGFNHPGSYHGLLTVANATQDQKLAERVTAQVLSLYDLEKGWAIAHIGHKQKLSLELRPLLFDIADALSPYKEPRRTEPLYRFLVSTGHEARGLYGLGISLQSQGKIDEARPLLQQAHDQNPVYPAP